MIVYRCPNCAKDTALWRGLLISGWQGIDGEGNKTRDREVDWEYVDEQSEGGCGECGWDGLVSSMRVTLGIDGEPLPEIHPAQIAIEGAA